MIGACKAVASGPDLTVWWLNGAEYFALFGYDPVANTYSEIVPGLAAGRAAVTAGPTTVFSIQGTPCLQGGADGSVQAAGLNEMGPGGNAQPQLQFMIGPRRVATVSASQLRVNSITEGAPAAGNVFQIYAEGTLAGTLAAAGLVATAAEEAI